MKKVLLYFVVFIVVYLTFLVATVPAQFVLGQVTLPKNVNISGVSGTIWQSQFKQISHDKIQLNKVRADLSAWSLLSLTPTVDINFGDPMQHGPVGELTLIVLDNELRVEDAKISLAANDIIKNANLAIDVDAKGYVDIELAALQLGKPMCHEVQGNINWPKGKVNAFNEDITLGTLKARLGCEQGALTLTVDEKNDLGLSYTAYMRQVGKVTGNGYLTPGDKFPEKIKPALGFLGKPDNQGRYRLSL
ncbi:type II secretion system protein N [Thalassotalea agariperforans]